MTLRTGWKPLLCIALWLGLAGTTPARAADAALVAVKTPRGAQQSFILIKPQRRPVASVILFAGGSGALGLRSASEMKWGRGNFLVRTREDFAARGLLVAVVDAPSDRQEGMQAGFRMSGAHAGDIGAVAAYLRNEAAVPVWAVGTSMGTFSAANAAIATRGIGGLVLTSTITRSPPRWTIAGSHPDGVASMALSRVKAPTLILSHRDDGCDITPAADAGKLKARLTQAAPVEVVLLDGGRPPRSEPCEAASQHGFLGIEGRAVDTIARFVAAHSR